MDLQKVARHHRLGISFGQRHPACGVSAEGEDGMFGDVGSGASALTILTIMVVIVAIGYGIYGYSKFKKG
jgi:hypothetical protein